MVEGSSTFSFEQAARIAEGIPINGSIDPEVAQAAEKGDWFELARRPTKKS